ncbi:hypothetical protein F383_38615 [Gossypium arboreum]|nr:hypothetical protein F383_38615 [Gossypium arboreum]
MSGTKAS